MNPEQDLARRLAELALRVERKQVAPDDLLFLEQVLDRIDKGMVIACAETQLRHSRLPSFVALPLAGFESEWHLGARLHRWCDLVEVLVKFVAMLGLAELKRQRGDQPLPGDLLRSLGTIERPTFGQWVALLSDLLGHLPPDDEAVVPGLAMFVRETVLTLVPPGGSETHSVVELRNQLVHSGSCTRSWTADLLDAWKTRIDGLVDGLFWLESLAVCVVEQGTPRRLTGACLAAGEAVKARLDLDGLEGHVVVLCDGRLLDLWPLCHYGRSERRHLDSVRRSETASPQVYYRCERDELLYAALGADPPIGGDRNALDAFMRLFKRESNDDASAERRTDFEHELRVDAQGVVGRHAEVLTIKQAVSETANGVLWVWGPGGIGKSMLMAKVAVDLGNDPRRCLRIAWRFKASDQQRCNRNAFFQHAIERLERWLGEHEVISDEGDESREGSKEGLESPDPMLRLQSLLSRASRLPEITPSAKAPDRMPWSRKVVFVLDGLDEIALSDSGFATLPSDLAYDHVVWLCSGRHELALEQAFSPERCKHVFARGLPGLTAPAVRQMLMDGTGELKYGLQRLDRDIVGESGALEMRNALVDAITEKADGLPLYVHYLVQDILSGAYRFDSPIDQLPDGLASYYDQLLRRLGVGALQAIVTPLVVTLAWAMEPLDESTLFTLLVRRTVLSPDAESREWLRRALEALRSLTRIVPAENGTPRYSLYHHTLREFIRNDPHGLIGPQNLITRRVFCDLAMDWASLSGEPFTYALLYGPSHLLQHGDYPRFVDLLCNIRFVNDKVEAGLCYDLVWDYHHALERLPDKREIELRERRQRIDVYCAEMLACSRFWTKAREDWWRDPVAHPLPSADAYPLPEPPPLVRRWTDEEIEADRQRILTNPTPTDKLRAFSTFVSSQSALLQKYSHLEGFAVQQAYNSAREGPVAEAAQLVARRYPGSLLLRADAERPAYNPHPLERTMRGLDAGRGVEHYLVNVTADFRRAVGSSVGWDVGRVRTYDLHDLSLVKSWYIGDDHSEMPWVDRVAAIDAEGTMVFFSAPSIALRSVDLRAERQHEWSTDCAWVCSIDCTPDGEVVATGFADGNVFLWRTRDREILARLPQYSQAVTAIALCPRGVYVTVGTSDGRIEIWDGLCSKRLHSLVGHESAIVDLKMTACCQYVLSVCEKGELIYWDVQRETAIRHMTLDGGAVSLSCTANAKRTIVGQSTLSGSGGKTVLLDVDRSEVLLEYPHHDEPVTSVQMRADGAWALSADRVLDMRVLDIECGRDLSPRGAMKVSEDSPNRRYVTVWGDAENPVHSSDGRFVYKLEKSIGLTRTDLATNRVVTAADLFTGSSDAPDFMFRLSPCNNLLLTQSNEGDFQVWDASSLEEVSAFKGWATGKSAPIWSADLSSCGRYLAACTESDHLAIYDFASRECLHTNEEIDFVHLVGFFAGDTHFVSVSRDSIRVWNAETGNYVAAYPNSREANFVAFGPSGFVVGKGNECSEVIEYAPPITIPNVTAVRLWQFGKNGARGRWAPSLTYLCPHCNERHNVPAAFTQALEQAAGDASAINPAERIVTCSGCHLLVELNPFVVDNKRRR